MKTIPTAALLAALVSPAFAQSGTNVPPGQSTLQTTGIDVTTFAGNTDSIGMGDHALSTALVAGGATQATATPLTAKINYIAAGACAAGSFILPNVQRYESITVMNRSGAACSVYPTLGAAVESAAGTSAAVNTAITQASNTDVIYRPVLLASGAIAWVQ